MLHCKKKVQQYRYIVVDFIDSCALSTVHMRCICDVTYAYLHLVM